MGRVKLKGINVLAAVDEVLIVIDDLKNPFSLNIIKLIRIDFLSIFHNNLQRWMSIKKIFLKEKIIQKFYVGSFSNF